MRKLRIVLMPICGPWDGHPSGRPVRRQYVRRAILGDRRSDVPLSPGLRRTGGVSAIGFRVHAGSV